MSKVAEYFELLQQKIHSVVFATVGEDHLPYTCVIDIMLAKGEKLYFLTSRGKAFYDRLMQQQYVAFTGMTGEETLSVLALSVRGCIRNVGSALLEEIFLQNPYMNEIYPTAESRQTLCVFELYRGEMEVFCLSNTPIRQVLTFGGAEATEEGYEIGADCIGCGQCAARCPSGAILSGTPCRIDENRCICCGNCMEACAFGAVRRRGR